MNLPGRFLSLKILAAAAMSMLVYAGTVTLRTALFNMDGGFFSLLLFVAILFLGHLAGWLFWGKTPVFASHMANVKFIRLLSFMLHIKDGARFIAALAAWSVILLPLLTSLLAYRSYGIWRILFEVLLAMIAFSMSLKYSRLASTQILHNAAAYTGFIILAVCLEIPYFLSRLAYLRPWLFVTSYFFILAYLIIKNQEDIDSNIFDKKHVEKSILPKNLRRFNTLSVCVVFLAIILFFNLKPIIIYILQLLGKLIVLIIYGVLWILKNILPSQEAAEHGGSAAQNFDFFMKDTEIINPFKNLINNIIKNFVILYLTYRILLSLVRKLPGFVRKIVELIKRLLCIKKGEKSFETMDYSDETETLKPAHENDNKRKLKKKMRKNRRDLRNISDPVERVRYMYFSILHMLPLLGVQSNKYDTTMDILRKTEASGKVSKELSPFTTIYNQVRYGDKVPDTGMLAEAEEHFGKAVEVFGQK